MFYNQQWQTYSNWAGALVVNKTGALLSALTSGGVASPIQDYYDPIFLLLQNKRALDYYIAYNQLITEGLPQYSIPPYTQGDVEYVTQEADFFVNAISKLSTTN